MTPDKEQTMGGEERNLADVVEWAAMDATEQADEYQRKADRAAKKHNHTFALTWRASERTLRENASMLNDLARRLRRGGEVERKPVVDETLRSIAREVDELNFQRSAKAALADALYQIGARAKAALKPAPTPTSEKEREWGIGGFQDLACAVSDMMWGGELGWTEMEPQEFIAKFRRWVQRLRTDPDGSEPVAYRFRWNYDGEVGDWVYRDGPPPHPRASEFYEVQPLYAPKEEGDE